MDYVAETTAEESLPQAMARRYHEVLAAGEGSVLPSEASAAVAAEFGSDAHSVILAVATTMLAEKGMRTRRAETRGGTVLIVEGHSSLGDAASRALSASARGIQIVVLGDRHVAMDIETDGLGARPVAGIDLPGGFVDEGIVLGIGDMFDRPIRDGDVLDRLFSDPPHRGHMIIKHRRDPDPCPVEILDDRRDRPNWQSPYGPARGKRQGRRR